MQNELFQPEDARYGLRSWQPSNWPVAAGWNELVAEFLSSETGRILAHSVKNRIDTGAVIYPAAPLKALELTPLDQVRVVILGQDPYQRNCSGIRQFDDCQKNRWVLGKLGKARRFVAQHLFDGGVGPTSQSCQIRLGSAH